MDEKTAALRDIFVEVTETETVTESQADTRGTLAGSAHDAENEVREVVTEMRARYSFRTNLSDETYVAIVRAVHDGDDDETIARDLALDEDTVFDARLDVHLLRESDTDVSVDLDALEVDENAADVDDETVERYRRAVAARDEARAANYRYQAAFAEILTDADLEGGFTEAVRDDGLEEAAADIETDVSF